MKPPVISRPALAACLLLAASSTTWTAWGQDDDDYTVTTSENEHRTLNGTGGRPYRNIFFECVSSINVLCMLANVCGVHNERKYRHHNNINIKYQTVIIFASIYLCVISWLFVTTPWLRADTMTRYALS